MLKRFVRSWAVCLLAALCIGGCAVNQTEEIGLCRQVLDAGISECAAPFDPQAPLTLTAALAWASARNEQLAMAGESYLQSLIEKERAFAAFLPTIRFAPVFMFQGKTTLGAASPLIQHFQPDRATDAPVTGQMELHPLRDVPALAAHPLQKTKDSSPDDTDNKQS